MISQVLLAACGVMKHTHVDPSVAVQEALGSTHAKQELVLLLHCRLMMTDAGHSQAVQVISGQHSVPVWHCSVRLGSSQDVLPDNATTSSTLCTLPVKALPAASGNNILLGEPQQVLARDSIIPPLLPAVPGCSNSHAYAVYAATSCTHCSAPPVLLHSEQLGPGNMHRLLLSRQPRSTMPAK
jgi:hypothetical protein